MLKLLTRLFKDERRTDDTCRNCSNPAPIGGTMCDDCLEERSKRVSRIVFDGQQVSKGRRKP